MLTIDDLLTKIELYGIDNLSSSIPNKDRRILKNLAKMIKMPTFITESQGRLLTKILQENLESLNFIGTDLIPSLRAPTWSKSFRPVDSSRKISITKDSDGIAVIDIECSFNKDIKRILQNISKEMDGQIFKSQSRHCQFLLTEKNLLAVISNLKKFNFERTEQIDSLYKNILDINKHEVIESFNIENIEHKGLKLLLEKEIGNDRKLILINDRRIKYQFTVADKTATGDSLQSKLASRFSPKVFVNKENYQLIDLVVALQDLKRINVMAIFDEYDIKSCIQNLELIHSTLSQLGISPNVGVYLRFPNDGDGKRFNELVSEYGYNKQLDNHCRLAIIANGKLPKFFLKTTWYPDAIVSFSNQFRNNKTSIYCNSCDMIVYYNTQAPLIGVIDAIV
jgi:hypothetical protein